MRNLALSKPKPLYDEGYVNKYLTDITIGRGFSKITKLHGMHKPYANDFGKNEEILEEKYDE